MITIKNKLCLIFLTAVICLSCNGCRQVVQNKSTLELTSWEVAGLTPEGLGYVCHLDNGKSHMFIAPYESVNSELFFRQIVNQELLLVSNLLKLNRRLPESLFRDSPVVVADCIFGDGQMRRLHIQIVSRRVAFVLEAPENTTLDPERLIVIRDDDPGVEISILDTTRFGQVGEVFTLRVENFRSVEKSRRL